jgi:predicted RecB family nuclease
MSGGYEAARQGALWQIGRCKREDDLTLLPELGRATRETLYGAFPTVGALRSADITSYIHGRKTDFPGIGPETLRKFQARAKLRAGGGRPYAKAPLAFPGHARELFFDVETRPMLDLCYLHGFVVRENGDNSTERCVQFFADEPTPQSEEEAFQRAWGFIRDSQPSALYHYSPYERTILVALARRYPAVCSEEQVRALFAADDTVDLYYDAVRSHTEWPTLDYGIKTFAEYLGFSWRDPHPSGAASVRRYHEYLVDRDPARKQRILDYNEDDCRAMRVLLDALRGMPVAREH